MGSVVWVARGVFVTSVLLVAAWVLMLIYQIFTKTALTTLASSMKGGVPSLASTLNSKHWRRDLHMLFRLDVRSILSDFQPYFWEAKKDFHPVPNRFRFDVDGFSVV
jgi:hypothetical protein